MSKEKTSRISVNVQTNENNIPEKIVWSAEDGGVVNAPAQAMFMSFWDSHENTAMRIDLWTKEMSVDEMKKFFHQSLLTMADTFERATSERKICEDLRDYCHHFATKMGILPNEN